MSLEIAFKKLSSHAVIPQRANETDAGYDLCSVESYLLEPWERKVFLTNISMAIPVWYYGRVAPRSWLAVKYGLDVLAWVVDAWYRWDIWVVLLNTSKEAFSITTGMKIAQIIIEKYYDVQFIETDNLEESTRGEWWWGSSGM